MVDGDEDPEGGAAVAVDEGEELIGGGVVVLGFVRRGCGAWRGRFCWSVSAGCEGVDAVEGDAEIVEQIEWQIDAVALGVFFYVAEDVGELEGYAGFFGEFFGARVGVAEDADADQAYDGGYEVAVAVEVVEGGEGLGLRCRTQDGVEVHGGALDQLFEEGVGDVEALLGVAEGEEDGVVGRCPEFGRRARLRARWT